MTTIQKPALSDLVAKLREEGHEKTANAIACGFQQPESRPAEKPDQRKARRLKRRKARKAKRMLLDETWFLVNPSTVELNHFHRIINPHLYDEAGKLKNSTIITQSLRDFA